MIGPMVFNVKEKPCILPIQDKRVALQFHTRHLQDSNQSRRLTNSMDSSRSSNLIPLLTLRDEVKFFFMYTCFELLIEVFHVFLPVLCRWP